MKRTLLIAGVGLLFSAGVAFGSFAIYQNRLSGDLKHTLTAAASPDCSEADLAVYIRDARLQVRTRKDREVFDKLTTAVQLGRDAEERNRLSLESSMSAISRMLTGKCHDYEQLNLRELRSSYGELMDQRCKQEIEQRKLERDGDKASSKVSQEEAAAARKLFNEFRADLKLPPIIVEQ